MKTNNTTLIRKSSFNYLEFETSRYWQSAEAATIPGIQRGNDAQNTKLRCLTVYCNVLELRRS